MSIDFVIFLIICIIALFICCVYLLLLDRHDKKNKTKNDLYHEEILNRLDDIERSIKYEKNK